ncbi:hypothetical protein [Listeria booriae]|uniref:hypothetical protein n=1 Tax=Listeria booriae TaxID=1552123 RepID=UPI001627D641|nr:hypothetical protein [Listeria booriae]MBC2164643.1 hypothetical protein [Listeria booriae]
MEFIILGIIFLILLHVPDYTEHFLDSRRKAEREAESKKAGNVLDPRWQAYANLWGMDSAILRVQNELEQMPDVGVVTEVRESLAFQVERLEAFTVANRRDDSVTGLLGIVEKYDSIFATIITTFEIANDAQLPVEDYPLIGTQEIIDSFIQETETFIAMFLSWQALDQQKVKKSLEEQLATEVDLLLKSKTNYKEKGGN